VMTPKGLLRLKQASVDAPGPGRRLVPAGAGRRAHRQGAGAQARPLLRKDLLRPRGARARDSAGHVAIARIEQLYPFPVEQKAALVASYPRLAEVVWAQEEPQNMGPWRAIRHRLEENLPEGVTLRYVGRPGARARARATRPHTCASRTGSSAKHWLRRA
jgi:2-oxoglutarate dehydrogenase E1 component